MMGVSVSNTTTRWCHWIGCFGMVYKVEVIPGEVEDSHDPGSWNPGWRWSWVTVYRGNGGLSAIQSLYDAVR